MQGKIPSRKKRGSRPTTSCTECRRRKQKCDQEQPCNNCKRRFPEPLCEYPSQPGESKATTSASSSADVADDLSVTRWLTEKFGRIERWKSFPTSSGDPTLQRDAQDHTWEADSDDDDSCSASGVGQELRESHRATERVIGTIEMTRIDDLAAWKASDLTGGQWKLGATGGGSLPYIAALPIQATKQNLLLISRLARNLYCFRGSLEGYPDPDNPFINHFLPWAIQSPMLSTISLYVSACTLTATQQVDPKSLMVLKGQAIRALNQDLLSGSVSDEAISGVSQFILNEWYFGRSFDMEAHLKGLRQMVLIRGGFDALGVKGLLSKVALVSDCVIAMSLEISPYLQNGFRGNRNEFDLHEPAPPLFKSLLNTPLLASLMPFALCVNSLGIHPSTASILDDVRFITNTVLNLPVTPSTQELQKVSTTATWIMNRIAALPEFFPGQDSTSPSTENTNIAVPPVHARTSPASTSSAGRPSDPTSTPSNPASPSSEREESGEPTQSVESAKSPKDTPPLPVTPQPDFLYAVTRLTALLYTRAIASRAPYTATVQLDEITTICVLMWRIPLSKWKSVLGVFVWILSVVIPCAIRGPFSVLIKSMLLVGSVQMGMEDWDVCIEMLRRGLRVSEWLRDGKLGEVSRGISRLKSKGKSTVMHDRAGHE